MRAPTLDERIPRAIALEVARTNAAASLALAGCAADIAFHWGDRARRLVAQATRWLEIAEAGAVLVAKDVDAAKAEAARNAPAESCARQRVAHVDDWTDNAANDAGRRTA